MAADAASAAKLLDAGKMEEAKEKAKDAVASLEGKPELVGALKTLILAEIYSDKVEDAKKVADEQLAKFKKANLQPGIVGMMVMKSKIALTQGKVEESISFSRQAWPLAKKTDDKKLQAEVLVAMVSSLSAKGVTKEALRAASSSMAVVKESGDKLSLAELLHATAKLQLQEEDASQAAVASAEEASSTYKAVGSKRGEAAALTTLAKAQCMAGELSDATKSANAALDLWRPLELAAGSVATLDVLIEVQIAKGQPRVGIAMFEDELSKMKAAGISAKNEAIMLEKFIAVSTSQGFAVEAVNCYEKMITSLQESGDQLGEAKKLMEVAEMHFSMNQFKDAIKPATKADAIFTELGETELGESAKKLIMDCYTIKGEPNEAPYRSEALLALKKFYFAVKERDSDKFKEAEELLEKYTALITDKELSMAIQLLLDDVPEETEDDAEPIITAMKFMEQHGWDLQKYKKEMHIFQFPHLQFYIGMNGSTGMGFGPAFRGVHPYRLGKVSDGKGHPPSTVVAQCKDTEDWNNKTMYRHCLMDSPIQSSQLSGYPPA